MQQPSPFASADTNPYAVPCGALPSVPPSAPSIYDGTYKSGQDVTIVTLPKSALRRSASPFADGFNSSFVKPQRPAERSYHEMSTLGSRDPYARRTGYGANYEAVSAFSSSSPEPKKRRKIAFVIPSDGEEEPNRSITSHRAFEVRNVEDDSTSYTHNPRHMVPSPDPETSSPVRCEIEQSESSGSRKSRGVLSLFTSRLAKNKGRNSRL